MSWPLVPLGDLFSFVNGRGFKKSEWSSGGLPIIRIQNLNDPGASFNRFDGEYKDSILVGNGDLLFSWSGSLGSSFGPHRWQRGPGLLNQHIFRVIPKVDVDLDYAFFALLHITREVERSVNGAVGLVHISKSKLEKFKVKVPSLAEQHRIAALLDEATDAISALESVYAQTASKLTDLRSSALASAMAEQEWPLVPLGDICHVIAGQSPPGKYYNSDGSGMPFHQGKKDFRDRFLGQPSVHTTQITKIARFGDVVMSVRAPVGPVNQCESDVCIGRGLAAIRPSERVLSDYLFYVLRSREADIGGTEGAVFASINRSQIQQIEIPLPPLEDQARIVALLDKVSAAADEALALASTRLEAAKALRQSILESAFRGEL